MKFITRTITSYEVVAVCFDKTTNSVRNVTFSCNDEVNDENALTVARDYIERRDKTLSVIMVNAIVKSNALYRVSVTDFLRIATKVRDVEGDGGDE